MKYYKLSDRKELIRRYAVLIFTNGNYFEQVEFLKQYNEKRFLHWDFNKIIDILDSYKNQNEIDNSIKRIQELNKIIIK